MYVQKGIHDGKRTYTTMPRPLLLPRPPCWKIHGPIVLLCGGSLRSSNSIRPPAPFHLQYLLGTVWMDTLCACTYIMYKKCDARGHTPLPHPLLLATMCEKGVTSSPTQPHSPTTLCSGYPFMHRLNNPSTQVARMVDVVEQVFG